MKTLWVTKEFVEEHLFDILERFRTENEEYIITENGKSIAKLSKYNELSTMQTFAQVEGNIQASKHT